MSKSKTVRSQLQIPERTKLKIKIAQAVRALDEGQLQKIVEFIEQVQSSSSK